jgi:hypothetical protein
MKSKSGKFVNAVLLAAALALPLQQARAEIVSTREVAGAAQSATNRERVLEVVGRAEVEEGLVALGVDAQAAKARVAALTEDEVNTLAGKLDNLPAGARLNHTEFVLLIILIIVLALAL